jgi:hypothetical protein
MRLISIVSLPRLAGIVGWACAPAGPGPAAASATRPRVAASMDLRVIMARSLRRISLSRRVLSIMDLTALRHGMCPSIWATAAPIASGVRPAVDQRAFGPP